MINERRRYTCTPGKRDAVLIRFDEVVYPLFDRHGIEIIAFWLDGDNPDAFVYICRWRDQAHMDETWAAFQADPDWIAAKEAGDADGPTVASIDRAILVPHERPGA